MAPEPPKKASGILGPRTSLPIPLCEFRDIPLELKTMHQFVCETIYQAKRHRSTKRDCVDVNRRSLTSEFIPTTSSHTLFESWPFPWPLQSGEGINHRTIRRVFQPLGYRGFTKRYLLVVVPPSLRMLMDETPIKIVMLGDSHSEKTSILSTFCGDVFPEARIPPAQVKQFTKIYTIDGMKVTLDLWDNSGHGEADKVHTMLNPGSDAVIVCFSMNNACSFDHVLSKWMPEVKHYLRSVPVILVGKKSCCWGNQIRQSYKYSLMKSENMSDTGCKYGVSTYVGGSVLSSEGLDAVFDIAIRAVLERRHYKIRTHTNTRCCIL
ncbi:hypothetical protein ScPMuIL_003906 [Solemya velum]